MKIYCNILLSFCITLIVFSTTSLSCEEKFEGFGVFLGSNAHFSKSKEGIEEKVIDVVYNFLGIRLFRTSYEEMFSPEPNKYEITCKDDPFVCSWIKVHKYISTLPDAKVFASVWSPPHYMKNNLYQLLPENEEAYMYFLKNITAIIQRDYNITIEKVSPVNEPENFLAPWDHTNMTPEQLCRIIKMYDDPLISVCPENSYFWITRIYYNYISTNSTRNCTAYCEVQGTHAYALNLNAGSPNAFLAYYDPKPYADRGTNGPIWMTEVSSTFKNANSTQMKEALDLATNIINFVGTTCVQRYYFWYAYTLDYSGESLIWGDEDGNLTFPKKFFAYKSFVNASNTLSGPVRVNLCNDDKQHPSYIRKLGCIQFGDENRVLVNKERVVKELENNQCKALCCTTETNDYSCATDASDVNLIPGKSVCHCILNNAAILNNGVNP